MRTPSHEGGVEGVSAPPADCSCPPLFVAKKIIDDGDGGLGSL